MAISVAHRQARDKKLNWAALLIALAVAGASWYAGWSGVRRHDPFADALLYLAPIAGLFVWAGVVALLRITFNLRDVFGVNGNAQNRRAYLRRAKWFIFLSISIEGVAWLLFVGPAKDFAEHPQKTGGKVVEAYTRNHGTSRIEYWVNGRTYEIYGYPSTRIPRRPVRVGNPIVVYYEADNPIRASLDPAGDMIVAFWKALACAIVIPFVVVGLDVANEQKQAVTRRDCS